MKLNPYLRFNDEKCREAMTFYKNCLGGEVAFQTIGETPMAKEMPPESQHRIMHAVFKNGDMEFFAADMMRDVAKVGDNFAMSISGKDEAKLREYFEKLSEGGEVFMPLEKVFWGGIFGMVTDKYGVEWMVNQEV